MIIVWRISVPEGQIHVLYNISYCILCDLLYYMLNDIKLETKLMDLHSVNWLYSILSHNIDDIILAAAFQKNGLVVQLFNERFQRSAGIPARRSFPSCEMVLPVDS